MPIWGPPSLPKSIGITAAGLLVLGVGAVFTLKGSDGVSIIECYTATGCVIDGGLSVTNGPISNSGITLATSGLTETIADNRYVNTSGDTITGSLVVNGTLTASGGVISPSRPVSFQLSNTVTRATTGTLIVHDLTPYDGQFYDAAILAVTNGSGVTIDVNINGTSIFTTPITIDEQEATSRTATAAFALGDSTFNRGDILTIDIDSCGDTSAGAQCPMGLSLQLTATGSIFP
jgi:hypothetical protein